MAKRTKIEIAEVKEINRAATSEYYESETRLPDHVLKHFAKSTCGDIIHVAEGYPFVNPLHETGDDLAYCAGEVSQYQYDTAPMKQGELCGVKYIAYDWVQSIAMSAKTSLSVIDLGDKRVYVGCDVSAYDKQ